MCRRHFRANSLRKLTGKNNRITGIGFLETGNNSSEGGKRPFLTHLLSAVRRSVLADEFQKARTQHARQISNRERYGEAFWIGDLTTDDGKNAAAWAGR
jgi:hypothetical protein